MFISSSIRKRAEGRETIKKIEQLGNGEKSSGRILKLLCRLTS